MTQLKILPILLLAVAACAQASEKQRIASSASAQTSVEAARAASPSITAEQFFRRALAHPPKIASASQLAEWLKIRSALLIDVRNADEFKYQHLQGAINLPAAEITEATLKKIAPDKSTRIVIYCSDTLFPTRRIALTTLGAPSIRQLGYSRIYTLEDLWQAQACSAAIQAARAKNRGNAMIPEQPLSENLSVCGELLPLTDKITTPTN
jgi:Rhodanese-like domain